MDLQKDFLNMQIAYEKNCAIRCNCSYEELKAQLDRSESLFGTRYLEGSPRHENWLLWVEAWQAAKAQAVPKGFVLVPKEPTFRMSFAYQMNSVAPISSLSVSGYKAMIEVQGQSHE
ncbi:hypothetical protein [Acinetobacter towneri]|uniref:hypothetical protein n=1 Tax=Acinetobacter towneri TaxID=202956 RepID=UPI003A8C0DD9